jgi:hypothetical protein
LNRYLISFLILVAAASGAETGTPILLGIEPPCAQVGTRQEVVLRGVRLSDIEEVMCRDAGVRVQRIGEKKVLPGDGKTPEKDEVRVELEFAADVPVGNVALHVRTRSGVSNPRTLHVNRLPAAAARALRQLPPAWH